MRSLILLFHLSTLLFYLMPNTASSQVDALTLSEVILNPTFEHIAVHVAITGDENRNSTLEIEYKPTGSSIYQMGALTMRAFPEMHVDGSDLDMNFHAGSAMYLMPNTKYDLRLTIDDPDGGSQVINTNATTRKFPTQEDSDDIIYVVPGTSGGDGSMANPYQGLQTAVSVATAGNIIEVADGT